MYWDTITITILLPSQLHMPIGQECHCEHVHPASEDDSASIECGSCLSWSLIQSIWLSFLSQFKSAHMAVEIKVNKDFIKISLEWDETGQELRLRRDSLIEVQGVMPVLVTWQHHYEPVVDNDNGCIRLSFTRESANICLYVQMFLCLCDNVACSGTKDVFDCPWAQCSKQWGGLQDIWLFFWNMNLSTRPWLMRSSCIQLFWWLLVCMY